MNESPKEANIRRLLDTAQGLPELKLCERKSACLERLHSDGKNSLDGLEQYVNYAEGPPERTTDCGETRHWAFRLDSYGTVLGKIQSSSSGS